jgi:enterochelin esterase family protein
VKIALFILPILPTRFSTMPLRQFFAHSVLALFSLGAFCPVVSFAQTPGNGQSAPLPLSTSELMEQVAKRNAKQLPDRLRQAFGQNNLPSGVARTSELSIIWAIEKPGLAKGQEPHVVSEDREFDLTLRRIGDSDIYAEVVSLPEGAAIRYAFEVNGKREGDFRQTEVYTTDPDNRPSPQVPKGTVTQMPPWKSQIYAGTVRDWWVYVPAQYKADGPPACVMVYQDGSGPKNDVPVVLDNLIARGELPVMAAVFINPGRFEEGDRSNRSVEYDTLSDKYARFLLEEILPEVEKTIKLRKDAAGRGIAGVSSGGICAFTAAWEKPDQFSKVLSAVGSFVNLQGGQTGIGGGHNYPTLIRKSRGNVKPIRVYLSDGSNDLDNPFGHWPLANQQMVRALDWAGYDYKFVYGQGFHGGRFGQALMPQSLKWLWRSEAPNPKLEVVGVQGF